MYMNAKLSFDVKADGKHTGLNSSVAIATGFGTYNENSIFGKDRDFFQIGSGAHFAS
jgi:hypothetical protein